MPIDRKRIGARFKESRAAAKLSQKEAAAQLDMSQQAISSWEAGDRMPSATQLGRLAMLYGRPSDYLLFGVETVPVALLQGSGDRKCVNLGAVSAGFRMLVRAMAGV